MSALQIQKAVRHQERARVALIGPSGSGKTMTALLLAQGLVNGGRVGLIDSEHGSASKYAGEFDFDTLRLPSFEIQTYIEAIKLFGDAGGYDVLVIDSLSHAWTQGALKMVDEIAERSRSKDSYAAWRTVTPEHNQLIDTILASPLHVIATMRVKTEYVREQDERGKTHIRKVGLAPVQRDGMEYEFDVVADIDTDHTMIVSKSRVPVLADKIIKRPGVKVGEALRAWLSEGSPAPVPEQPVEPAPHVSAIRVALDAIGADGRKRIVKELKAQGGAPADPSDADAWAESIHDRWGLEPLSEVLKRLDAPSPPEPSSTPLTRLGEDDAKLDKETEGLFDEHAPPAVKTLPMYGTAAPS
jgi:energy-coupling factor transporter ATP-binding protein EcfA2